ncbi:MAG: AAA family ATPase [Clostridia bacterium]|nr:AAA family ATPase [Clostridia bacterium]
MVILIIGASHTGKTLMMKKLIEKTRFPALSLDHLKMGLIRAGITRLTPEDDEKLTEYLWRIAAEMIKTAVENRQDLILEGCYVPENWRESFDAAYLTKIRAVYLIMTRDYVTAHFDNIRRYADAIEYRLPEQLDRDGLIRDNERYDKESQANGTPRIVIKEGYDEDAIFREMASLLRVT